MKIYLQFEYLNTLTERQISYNLKFISKTKTIIISETI